MSNLLWQKPGVAVDTQIQAFATTALRALSTANFASLDETQLAALTTTQVTSLTNSQLNALNTTNVGALLDTQIGAFSTPNLAEREYSAVVARYPQLTQGATRRVQEVTASNGSTVYRTTVTGLSREQAVPAVVV